MPLRTWLICLLLLSLLAGCADADLSLRFDSQTRGQLVQTLHVGEGSLALGEAGRDPFLQALTAKARSLSGSVRKLDEDSLEITLPFSSGPQLVERFKAFYDLGETGSLQSGVLGNLSDAPSIRANLELQQQNYLFALRNDLTFELRIDLLAELPAASSANRSTAALARRFLDLPFNDRPDATSDPNLDFHLTTPWGLVDAADAASNGSPEVRGRTATWHLAANRPHRIEAIFWIPSPIGIGAGAIALFCLLGYTVKYRLLARGDRQQ